VACGWEPPDCIAAHWSPKLKGHAEKATSRAPCPLCGEARRLSYWPEGGSVRWKNHCGCGRDALRAKLADLLPGCVSVRYSPKAKADSAELVSLALSGMPVMSLRLALLELSGMGTREALDKLGVGRTHRGRVIAGRQWLPILVHIRRSRWLPILVHPPVPILVHLRRSQRFQEA